MASSSAAAVMAQYGLVNTDAIVQAARLEGMELAAAATMISKESSGRMVWGSDPVSTGGVYTKGGLVTRENYLAYRALANAGKVGRQGVGMAQLTSKGFQDSGDALGGCWDPVANARAGFRGMQRLIAAYGTRDGARRYNGSGPAAERYAADFMARYATWKQRLAGATVPPVSPPEVELSAQFESDARKRWPAEDSLDHDIRADLHVKQLELDGIRDAVAALTAKVDALASKLDVKP